MRDPAVREQLKAKYPEGRGGMPLNLGRSAPVEHLRGLRENLLSLDKTTAPGTGGLRPDYLTTLAQLMEADQMAKLEEFGLRYDQVTNYLDMVIFFLKKLLWGPRRPKIRDFCYNWH